jgi:hypothetical protein
VTGAYRVATTKKAHRYPDNERYAIRVWTASGELVSYEDGIHPREVAVRRRNAILDALSETAESVTANPIP